MSTSLTHFHTKSLARAGSFWTQILRPQDRPTAGALARLAFQSASAEAADVLQARLDGERRVIRHAALPFEHVVQVGMSLNARQRTHSGDFDVVSRPSSDDGFAGSDSFIPILDSTGSDMPGAAEWGDYLLFPRNETSPTLARHFALQEVRYIVQVPQNLHIDALQDEAGNVLYAGVDFWRVGDTQLLMQDSPHALFPNGALLIVSGWEDPTSAFSQALGIDTLPGKFVWRWIRGVTGSPEAFRRAVAEAAGLLVFQQDATIHAVISELDGSTTYVTSTEVLRARYPHTPLVDGQTVLEGEIVGGEGLTVTSGNSSSRWYRALDWSAGLSLDGLCPVAGITVADAEVLAEVVATAGGKLLVEFPVGGAPEDVTAFWGHVRRSETRSGKYLSDALPVAVLGDTCPVNPLDFFLQNQLGEHLMIVDLALSDMSPLLQERARAFIQRNKPAGHVVVVREA